jgi:ribosomal protein S18 acetylase RimI-like enzyme
VACERGGELRGWISVGPSRDVDALASTGELWAIYVAPDRWRQGVGQRLWDAAAIDLQQAGYSEATLWALKDNVAAIAFYRANGFVLDPGTEKPIHIGGAELIETRLRKSLAAV